MSLLYLLEGVHFALLLRMCGWWWFASGGNSMVSQCNGLSCVLSLVDGTALALSGLDLRRCNQSIGLFENDVAGKLQNTTWAEQNGRRAAERTAVRAGGTVLRCVYALLLLAVDHSLCSNNSELSSAVLKSGNPNLHQFRSLPCHFHKGLTGASYGLRQYASLRWHFDSRSHC